MSMIRPATSDCCCTSFFMPVRLVVGARLPLDIPVPGIFEEDCPEYVLAGKAGAGDDTRAQLMHEVKHLLVSLPGVVSVPVAPAHQSKKKVESRGGAVVQGSLACCRPLRLPVPE